MVSRQLVPASLGGMDAAHGEEAGVNTVSFTLSSLPGSVNVIYGPKRTIHSANGWGLRDEWLLWMTRMTPYVRGLPRSLQSDSVIRIDRCYYYPWFTKTGQWRRADTANMDKITFDLISRKLGIDDLYFKCGYMDSRDSDNPRVEVTLTEIPKIEWASKREGLVSARLI